jgi:hypothetical protein
MRDAQLDCEGIGHGMAAIDSNCLVFSGFWLMICVKQYPCADGLHDMSFTTRWTLASLPDPES